MARKQSSAQPAKVKSVRARIERWRKTRKRGSPMPEDLWEAAVLLARSDGIYRIARALSLNYESLKRRASNSPKGGQGGDSTAGFIELNANQLIPSLKPDTTVVELADRDGSKLTIRLPGSGQVDVLGLVSGFWSRQS